MRPSVAIVFSLATFLADAALSQIVVPGGWAVDQLVGRLDNKTPRIEAIRNSAFGTGVVTASVSGNILTVRRIAAGSVDVIATKTLPASGWFVQDVRFDPTGLFGNSLFVSAVDAAAVRYRTELLRVDAPGVAPVTVASVGNQSNDGISLTLDFTVAASGFAGGAYMNDLDGADGTSYWYLPQSGSPTRLASDLVYPGRLDMDVRGVEFDRSGVYGGNLILVDSDENNSGLSGIFALNAARQWGLVGPQVSTGTRYIRDIAVSAGGALGPMIYILEAREGRVASVSPTGTVTTFASGLSVAAAYDSDADGAPSLSVSDDGNTMYVSDTNGVYRIRLIGNAPGPTILMTEPSLPPGAAAFTNPGGLPHARVLWSHSVTFSNNDLAITRISDGQSVPFAASGSGSQFMLISFGSPLENDAYSITIRETVRSTDGVPIDGDGNGINGGNAVLTLTHSTCDPNACPADFNQDGGIDGSDVQAFFDAWEAGVCR